NVKPHPCEGCTAFPQGLWTTKALSSVVMLKTFTTFLVGLLRPTVCSLDDPTATEPNAILSGVTLKTAENAVLANTRNIVPKRVAVKGVSFRRIRIHHQIRRVQY